jgi:L-aminopeptidase/D-esterase-like protein
MKTRPLRTRCAALLGLALAGGAALAQVPGPNNDITDVPGIRVGHATGADSGATVVLAANANGQGVGGGVTQRGGSPGTRETDLMRPDNMVEVMNAVVLSGGSSFGLATGPGVMQCLEQRGIGFPVGGGNVVPIVQAAVSFDRATCGAPPASRPDFNSGLQACLAASTGPIA